MSAPLIDTQLVGGHGGQGSEEKNFTRLLIPEVDYETLRFKGLDPNQIIRVISDVMDQGTDDPSDIPDDQENPFVPAGYTYFGQFIDHDLTLDTRSTLNTIPQSNLSSLPDNMRTPRFDLDNLYGLGPDAAPYMYDVDGRLATNLAKPFDLPRAANPFDSTDPMSHRAIIGDPRNDENSIVCQLQLAFIQFHNRIIDHLKAAGTPQNGLFKAARREVQFTYQKIVVTDFLKRIIQKPVYDAFVIEHATKGDGAYRLYKPGPMRNALPVEFTGAAYRYGHSGVRNAYRLNVKHDFQRKIFDASDNPAESLIGFGDLPQTHEIEWHLFVTNALQPGEKGQNSSKRSDGAEMTNEVDGRKDRLQYAYKLDTSLVDPLKLLPPRISGITATDPIGSTFRSLAARNIKRGYNFSLPSGQDIADRLGVTKGPPLVFGEGLQHFKDMKSHNNWAMPATAAAALEAKTPLWLYVLAEGQACLAHADGSFPLKKDSDQGTQLGPVGGRIILEVFFGILDDDSQSYFNVDPNNPWTSIVKPGAPTLTLWDLLHFIGKV